MHENIRQLAEYWLQIHPEGSLPGRQHFDPIDVGRLLADLWLVDVVGRPPRFRYRLVGTQMVEYLGVEPTGRWIDEVFPHFSDTSTFRDLSRVVDEARPNWRRGAAALRYEKKFRTLERIFLPFATNGRDVDLVLNQTIFMS